MRKTFCDKCGKDCTFDERSFKCCPPHYTYAKKEDNHEVGVSELVLCLSCKKKFEDTINSFLVNQ